MQQLMQTAQEVQSTPFPTSNELLKTLALQMLWRYIGEGEQHTSQRVLPLHPAVTQACQFMQAHLSEPLTLASIADDVALNPAYLIRLFQAHLHTTPMAYLWQQRLRTGIRLLEQTGLTVRTIAERSGFQSHFHFSRRIREVTGYTPLEMRRRAWRGSNE